MTYHELIQFIKLNLKKDNFDLSDLEKLAEEMQKMLIPFEQKSTQTNSSGKETDDEQEGPTPEQALTLYLMAFRSESMVKAANLSKQFKDQAQKVTELEADLKAQIAYFQQRTQEQVDVQTQQAHRAITDLQTSVVQLLATAAPTRSESVFNTNERLLTQLQHAFFEEYNGFELKVRTNKRSNNNSTDDNGNKGRYPENHNQIVLYIHQEENAQPTFAMYRYDRNHELNTYFIGTGDHEKMLVAKLKKSMEISLDLIESDSSVRNLLFRVIILIELRKKELLNKDKYNQHLLSHCATALEALTPRNGESQKVDNNLALALYDSKSSDETLASKKILEQISMIEELIRKIQRQLLNANVPIQKKYTTNARFDVGGASVLESLYSNIKKLRKEISSLYFISAGNFFEQPVQISSSSSSSTALSTFVIDPRNIRANLELDNALVLELYDKYDLLLKYISEMIKQVSKTALQESDKKHIDETKVLEKKNLKLLKSLRLKLLSGIDFMVSNTNSASAANDDEAKIQAVIIKRFEKEELLDQNKFISVLNETCYDALMVFEKAKSIIMKMDDSAKSPISEHHLEKIKKAIGMISKIKEKFPPLSLRGNDLDRNLQATDVGSQLRNIKSTFGKLGFIIMASLMKFSSEKNNSTSAYSWGKTTEKINQYNPTDFDEQCILDLHEICQITSEYLSLNDKNLNQYKY